MMFYTQCTVALSIVVLVVNSLPIQSNSICWVDRPQNAREPEQVHLSWWGDATEMWVTWVAEDVLFAEEYLVEYGQWEEQWKSPHQVYAMVEQFVDGGPEKRKMYMLRTCMDGLKPNTKYYYRVGLRKKKFWFMSLPEGENWSPRIAVFGDLGNYNGVSIGPLQEEVERQKLDMVWHVGDMAYDMYMSNGRCGDKFMRQMEPIASHLPYQTAVGNHEHSYNFSNYKARFTMPRNGDGENMYYSYNVGPAHVITYAGDLYYFAYLFGHEQVKNQFIWLEKDLMEADKPENRAKRPWIITMSHRPMYCSAYDGDKCTHKYNDIRSNLEKLFFAYGVDLQLFGHEHNYERLWPVFDHEVYNGTTSKNPYHNPHAPVHILSGAAGCHGPLDTFLDVQPKWSACRISKYGYGHLNILNKTHIHWEQIAVKEGKVVDQITLIKDAHNPYEKNPFYETEKLKNTRN